MDDSFFTTISEGRTIALLLAIRDNPRTIKELKPIMPNNTSLKNRLLQMEKEGLVKVTTIHDRYKYVVTEITDFGKRVADLFSIVNVLVLPNKEIGEKSIDKRHFDPIIRLLRMEQPMYQRNIRDEIGSTAPTVKMLNMMIEDGIVSVKCEKERVPTYWYSLTTLGEQIAAIYQTVYDGIRSSEE